MSRKKAAAEATHLRDVSSALEQAAKQPAPTAAELTGRDLTGEVERLDKDDLATLKRVMERRQFAQQIQARAVRADIEAKAVTQFFREGVVPKYNLGILDEITEDGRIIRKTE